MNDTRVTAVLVTYNSEDSVLEAIEALRPAHQEGWLDCILVDNHSSDRTVELVCREQPWVEVVPQSKNLGFGRGCNVAFARANTPLVLLLNPDAVLPAGDLRTLVDFFETHPKAGIVGPAICEPDGSLACAGRLPTPLEVLGRHFRYFRPYEAIPIQPGADPFSTDWLSGAILLLRRSMLDELGGFDPRFFLYFEETDLCRRAQARGWELWAHGGAVARHIGGASTNANTTLMFQGCIASHYFQSRYYYFLKHYGWCRATSAEVVDYLVHGVTALARVLTGRSPGPAGARVRIGMFRLPQRLQDNGQSMPKAAVDAPTTAALRRE